MKALVGAFNQEKALVGAFSVIVQPVAEPMDRFAALIKLWTFLDTHITLLHHGEIRHEAIRITRVLHPLLLPGADILQSVIYFTGVVTRLLKDLKFLSF